MRCACARDRTCRAGGAARPRGAPRAARCGAVEHRRSGDRDRGVCRRRSRCSPTASTSRINIYSLSRSIGINGVIGLAMMTVIVTGGLNLALGAIGVCSAMAIGWALQRSRTTDRGVAAARAARGRRARRHQRADRRHHAAAQLRRDARHHEHLLRGHGAAERRQRLQRAAAGADRLRAGCGCSAWFRRCCW